MRRIFILVVLLIVYGSLYPWTFVAHDVRGGPLWYLLHRWDTLANGYLIRDIFVNLAMYVPLGLFGQLAFGNRFRLLTIILGGAALSVSMELAQVYVPDRQASMVDVFCNAAGTGAGVWLARRAGPLGTRAGDRSAAFLAAGWLACILFPALPLYALPMIQQNGQRFIHSPVVSQMPAIPAFAIWYAAGLLLRAAGVPYARLWLALSLAAIAAQVHIIARGPLRWELAGAAAGVLLFAVRPARLPVTRTEAWIFVILTVTGSLWPFHFSGPPNPLWMVPFKDLIRTDGPTGLWIIVSQIVAWGTAIWLFMGAGKRLWPAAALVTALVAAAQLARIFVPDSRPGITAPLLALIAGYVLDALGTTGSQKAAQSI